MTFLVVGLGNPDAIYEKTFHNVGFNAVDVFAKSLDAQFKKNECKAKTAHVFLDGNKVIIAKPQTYMNLSGESVIALTSKYKIEQDKFLVVYDDADLPLGSVRIRESGSAGTHNGMKSVVQCVGTQQFCRIRIGIGKNPQMDMADFVLSRANEEQQKTLNAAYERVCEAIGEICRGASVQSVMQKYNGKGKSEDNA